MALIMRRMMEELILLSTWEIIMVMTHGITIHGIILTIGVILIVGAFIADGMLHICIGVLLGVGMVGTTMVTMAVIMEDMAVIIVIMVMVVIIMLILLTIEISTDVRQTTLVHQVVIDMPRIIVRQELGRKLRQQEALRSAAVTIPQGEARHYENPMLHVQQTPGRILLPVIARQT